MKNYLYKGTIIKAASKDIVLRRFKLNPYNAEHRKMVTRVYKEKK